ncbi:sulfate/thiosulfate ABC transporter substrate binding protein [Mycobacteroides abscessus subsp. abscessus]|nr:sulfate/thiosulfate ABC transporter substrate binding protein [Mycobacteroides abscessus subsp. abscessus]
MPADEDHQDAPPIDWRALLRQLPLLNILGVVAGKLIRLILTLITTAVLRRTDRYDRSSFHAANSRSASCQRTRITKTRHPSTGEHCYDSYPC